MKKYIFKNQEVNNILQWWADTYEFRYINTEDGILRIDLQQIGEDKIVTEDEAIKFFIEQIENKLYYMNEGNSLYLKWKKEIETLFNELLKLQGNECKQ